VAVRAVYRLPDPVLKRRALELELGDDPGLLDDLVETMRASPACVGLAAPQIGISQRAIVVDVAGHPKTTACNGLITMLNPMVVEASGREKGREGCMSVPDLTADVARFTELVVRGVSRDGSEIVVATEGFEARALQHEIDHLDGLLILDRVASLGTDVFRRKTYK
jgi:peptide deformylase